MKDKLGTGAQLLRENIGFLLLLLGMFMSRSSIADWYHVPTGSMQPTIVEGDRILVDKLAYDAKVPFTNLVLRSLNEPQYGDIVVFEHPGNGERLVKRLIGKPGDLIAMRDNQLLINGEPIVTSNGFAHRELNTGPFRHAVQFNYGSTPLSSFQPVTVPEGHYFMLGDNRNNSADSRVFGFVPRHLIQGRATSVIFSWQPDDFGFRENRFFEKLN